MGFERAKIVTKPATVGSGIKVWLLKLRAADAKMWFSISFEIATKFGWSDGDKIDVLIGDGEHHGLIRLRKNNSTGEALVLMRTTAGKKYVQLSVGHQETFVNRAKPAQWCKWREIDGYIEVTLPMWADETSPSKPNPNPNEVTVRVADNRKPALVGQRVKQNVTAHLMGDPPPGRREMLEKIGGF